MYPDCGNKQYQLLKFNILEIEKSFDEYKIIMVKHIKSQICSARTNNDVRDWVDNSPETLPEEEVDIIGMNSSVQMKPRSNRGPPTSPITSRSPLLKSHLQRHLAKGIHFLVSNGLGAWRTGTTNVHEVDFTGQRCPWATVQLCINSFRYFDGEGRNLQEYMSFWKSRFLRLEVKNTMWDSFGLEATIKPLILIILITWSYWRENSYTEWALNDVRWGYQAFRISEYFAQFY